MMVFVEAYFNSHCGNDKLVMMVIDVFCVLVVVMVVTAAATCGQCQKMMVMRTAHTQNGTERLLTILARNHMSLIVAGAGACQGSLT